MMIRLLVCTLLLLGQTALAYNYQEHKAIGNAALTQVLARLVAEGRFADSTAAARFMETQLHLRYDAGREEWQFIELSQLPNRISYGDLNGLSGDHQGDPLQLNDQLRYRYSVLNRIVLLQNQYGEQFFTNAPDKRLLNTDFQYGLLALTNFNHFFAYGKSLTWHLQTVRKADILDLLIPANTERVFGRLEKENAVRMYVTLHAVAIQLAQMAGQYTNRGETQAGNLYLFYALLYNAFADHFAQDMCAAGHMVVKRSLAGGVTNNKAIHDFYNKVGLNVVNRQGEVWKTNGDGTLNLPENEWRTAKSFALLLKTPVTVKYRRAVDANSQSVYEVMNAYLQAQQDGRADFAQSLPDAPTRRGEVDGREAFYLKQFGTLSLVPLPFESDVNRYFAGDARLAQLEQVNRIPYYRNYVRSRVANSLIVGLGRTRDRGTVADFEPYYTVEGRLILSSSQYNYHDKPRKRGTFDTWRGLTAAYVWGNRPPRTDGVIQTGVGQQFHQIKGGLNYVGDFWVTNNTYVGFHSYLETGVDLRDGKPAWLVSPSLGIQFLPFVGVQTRRLPKLAVRLVQLLVSQKFVASYQLISGRPSQLLIQSEFDLNF